MSRLERNRLSQQQSRKKKTDEEKEMICAKQREQQFLFGSMRSTFTDSYPAYEKGAHVPTAVEVNRMNVLKQERQLRKAQHQEVCHGTYRQRGHRCFSFKDNELPPKVELCTPAPTSYITKDRIFQADPDSGQLRQVIREVIHTPKPYKIKKKRVLKTAAERKMRAIQVAEKKMPLCKREEAQAERREKAVDEAVEQERLQCLLATASSTATASCTCCL